jgi:metallo-beta-lactamase family protein
MNGRQRRELLAAELNASHAGGGPLLIPAFAVERSQELLADILMLMDDREVPRCDIFLDSPLAIEATRVFRERGWNSATKTNPFAGLHASEHLKFTREPSESDELERLRGWHINMAASGMCDAGRVRKHLKRLLWRRDATILLSGYQAQGTLGRVLQEGARRVSIQGEDIQVRARVRSLDVYSGHADAAELTRWVLERRTVRRGLFLAHGEPSGLTGLKQRLVAAGFDAERILVPELDQTISLGETAQLAGAPKPRLAPAVAARADWHNARANFLAELNDQLETAPNDFVRGQLIAALLEHLRAADDQRNPATQAQS